MIVVRINNRRAHQTQFGYECLVMSAQSDRPVKFVGATNGATVLGNSFDRYKKEHDRNQAMFRRQDDEGNVIMLPDKGRENYAHRVVTESSRGAWASSDNEGTRGR